MPASDLLHTVETQVASLHHRPTRSCFPFSTFNFQFKFSCLPLDKKHGTFVSVYADLFPKRVRAFFSDEIHAIQRKNIPSRRICHPPVIAYKDFQSAEILHNILIRLQILIHNTIELQIRLNKVKKDCNRWLQH